jgi:hypothetical protein
MTYRHHRLRGVAFAASGALLAATMMVAGTASASTTAQDASTPVPV